MNDKLVQWPRRPSNNTVNVTIQQMIDAHARARLTVSLDVALADAALATCLKNTALAAVLDASRPRTPEPFHFSKATIDRMRLAAGDRDD